MDAGADSILDSVFFYSWGKFSLQCEGIKEQITYLDKSSTKSSVKEGTNCGSEALPTGYKPSLTSVNGISASPTSILASSGTGVYPIDRFLYNVYSNGSNSNIPEATAATLNYVSEVGFLCKPQTVNGAAESDAAHGDQRRFCPGHQHQRHRRPGHRPLVPRRDLQRDPRQRVPPGERHCWGQCFRHHRRPGSAERERGERHPHGVLAAQHGTYGAAYLTGGADAPGQTSNTSIPTGTSMPGYCILSTTDGNANS